MMVTCPVCGKLTVIYWPQFWVYRRGATFYCSENCKMVGETQDIKLINQVARERRIRKGVESMGKHRLTLEQKKKAVEIASQGGNQLEYLKKCGAKNPSAAWVYIKKTLMDKAPEKLEGVPAEKPILAEVVQKLPEKTTETATVEVKDEYAEWTTKEGDTVVRTKFDQFGCMDVSVEKDQDPQVKSEADVSILSAACKGFIFTNLSGGILIEKPERGQSLTIGKEEFGILMDALPKVAGIFKGGQ